MGPVSFEALPAGPDRAGALRRARLLADAGIRVASVGQQGCGQDLVYTLMIRSADLARARAVLDTPDP